MNTTRNRSKVMAIALRAATKELRRSPETVAFSQSQVNFRAEALDSIDVVAEELEAIANPRPKCSSSRGRGRGGCPNLATVRYRRTTPTGEKLMYARCGEHPLSARAGYTAESIAAPDPDGAVR